MFTKQRHQLAQSLKQKGIRNQKVLDAIATIPREKFVDEAYADEAYFDFPLPIDAGQTISQPFIVARMTEALIETGNVKKVLEIGTGSGYQAAILSQCVDEVFSVERIRVLYERAKSVLDELNFNNVHLQCSDGNLGWETHAPFDGIIVTAAATEVPKALLDQLAEGGRLVIPVGNFGYQDLKLIIRHGDKFEEHFLEPVVFVPMLGGIT